ncbi:uncharacterized protein RCO7_06303 [Rhynchosporium graminicola]|uniref:UBC core domain-containing protein n=1 Tax=Rhynchosporium graminicola TaxID=2792576 RepID=A0A1E1KW35_9HELO|nr:uncharacterized protein RCO7_06303 [Rhynchosporium commune]
MGNSSSKHVESGKGKGRGSDQSRSEVTEQRDRAIQSVQRLRAQFHSECSHSNCSEISPQLDYDRIFDTWLAGSQVVPPRSQFSTWTCKQGHSTCFGCGETPKLASESFFTSLGVVNHCCDRARQFTIWLLLSQFDSLCLESENNNEKKNKADAMTNAKSKLKAKAGTQGVGYGTSYGGLVGGWPVDAGDEALMTQALVTAELIIGHQVVASDDKGDILDQNVSQDDLLKDTVKILGACLPPMDSDTTLELDMFRLGILFDTITQLIRNDSIVDITERLEVYQATAEFVIKTANHPGLFHLLFEERPHKANTPGLGDLSLPSHISLHNLNSTSSTKPLIACYGDTYLQVRTFLGMLRNPKTTIEVANTRHSKETSRHLQDLVRCFETLDAVVARNADPIVDAQPEDPWARFADDNKVTFTDDVLLHHRYTENFKLLQTSNRGRLTTISKEIATLKTALPPGIFLKVAESRSDVMKVLIIGSEGTPYAGGLFVFDIFLDERYPATPPKITFTMHGNDEDGESFNPNLHLHSGMVCLSLLNTWIGDPSQAWQPYKSKILSVLVSIQAMILGSPMPWENEPGYEGTGTTTKNLAHKARVESRTLRFAMIAWLENKFAESQAKEYIWKDISRMYYLHNGIKVMGYVREWVADNPGLLNFGPTDYWLLHVTRIKPRLPPGMSVNNLVEKLSTLLDIKYEPAAFPTREVRIKESRPKRKSKASNNGTPSSKKLKASATPSTQFEWLYARDKTQKMVKKACKDFGIGYNNTIKASVEKLETHVNVNINKDSKSIDPELMETWGEMVQNPSQFTPSHQDLEDEMDFFTEADWQVELQAIAESSKLPHMPHVPPKTLPAQPHSDAPAITQQHSKPTPPKGVFTIPKPHKHANIQ